MGVLQLSRRDARRLAVRAQLLARPRPTDLHDVVHRLGFLQLEPTAAVAPAADLVLWSRVGRRYRPADLVAALEARTLVEHLGMVRPAADVRLFRAEMRAWPGAGELRPWQHAHRDWVAANDACRRDILQRLAGEGPLLSRELPDTCAVPWRSSGWTNDKNVVRLLELMAARGEVAVAGRESRERLWDLAERVYPDDGDDVPDLAEALRLREERRLSALGIARSRARQHPTEPDGVGAAGVEAVVDGVRGSWRVDPTLLDEPFRGRTALLSPFDRLVFDRDRLDEVFEFDYLLEMYKPAEVRIWGYFALPVLHGDRLVGKLDAAADRKAGVFRVAALHEDAHFTPAVSAAVHREIAALARWLGLDLVLGDEVSRP